MMAARFVTIDSVDLGPLYIPQQTWIKFAITFQYPYADIYPLFARPDLVRAGRPTAWERHHIEKV